MGDAFGPGSRPSDRAGQEAVSPPFGASIPIARRWPPRRLSDEERRQRRRDYFRRWYERTCAERPEYIAAWRERNRKVPKGPSPPHPPRAAILEMLGRKMSFGQIAAALGVTRNVVAGVKSRAGLCRPRYAQGIETEGRDPKGLGAEAAR